MSGDGWYVVAARSLESVDAATASTARLFAVGVPILVALMARLSWVLAGRALRPVEFLRSRASQITAAGTGARLPDAGTGDVIARLTETLNQMLERLGGLLTLARRDNQETAAVSVVEEVDLAALVRVERDRPRRLDTQAALDDGCVVRGDPAALASIVANLLDNADRHGRSQINIALTREGGWVDLTVTDDGEGIPALETERVFSGSSASTRPAHATAEAQGSAWPSPAPPHTTTAGPSPPRTTARPAHGYTCGSRAGSRSPRRRPERGNTPRKCGRGQVGAPAATSGRRAPRGVSGGADTQTLTVPVLTLDPAADLGRRRGGAVDDVTALGRVG